MGKKSNQQDDYIEDFKEWEDHQYDPYYFTGSRMPHFMKNPSRRGAQLILIEGVILIGFLIFIFAVTVDPNDNVTMTFSGNPLWDIVSVIFMFGIGILYILAGMKSLHKPPKKKEPPFKFRK